MIAVSQRPDIAIIIAAWNAQDTLGRAIQSARSQIGVNIEIFVIDDASTDGTLACAQDFAARDPRVTVLKQDTNAGPAAARNLALDVVKARYVTPLDSDDFMEAGRLARLLDMATQGGWDLVADDLLKVDETCVEGARTRLWSETDFGTIRIGFADFILGNLSSRHGGRGELGFIKPLISLKFLNENMLRYRQDMRLGEDYLLYATALSMGARLCLTDPTGYVAVTRDASLSGRHSTRDLGALVDADKMLMDLPSLGDGERDALNAHFIETCKKWHWMRLIDAFKARDMVAAARCFVAPPAVIISLLGNLRTQVFLRSTRFIGRHS